MIAPLPHTSAPRRQSRLSNPTSQRVPLEYISDSHTTVKGKRFQGLSTFVDLHCFAAQSCADDIMSIQPIRPNGDERIQHKTAVLNGYTYHYLYAIPNSGKWTETVFLVSLPKPCVAISIDIVVWFFLDHTERPRIVLNKKTNSRTLRTNGSMVRSMDGPTYR